MSAIADVPPRELARAIGSALLFIEEHDADVTLAREHRGLTVAAALMAIDDRSRVRLALACATSALARLGPKATVLARRRWRDVVDGPLLELGRAEITIARRRRLLPVAWRDEPAPLIDAWIRDFHVAGPDAGRWAQLQFLLRAHRTRGQIEPSLPDNATAAWLLRALDERTQIVEAQENPDDPEALLDEIARYEAYADALADGSATTLRRQLAASGAIDAHVAELRRHVPLSHAPPVLVASDDLWLRELHHQRRQAEGAFSVDGVILLARSVAERVNARHLDSTLLHELLHAAQPPLVPAPPPLGPLNAALREGATEAFARRVIGNRGDADVYPAAVVVAEAAVALTDEPEIAAFARLSRADHPMRELAAMLGVPMQQLCRGVQALLAGPDATIERATATLRALKR